VFSAVVADACPSARWTVLTSPFRHPVKALSARTQKAVTRRHRVLSARASNDPTWATVGILRSATAARHTGRRTITKRVCFA
jgi:hypothetical protein